jgi:hypothetical protein
LLTSKRFIIRRTVSILNGCQSPLTKACCNSSQVSSPLPSLYSVYMHTSDRWFNMISVF